MQKRENDQTDSTHVAYYSCKLVLSTARCSLVALAPADPRTFVAAPCRSPSSPGRTAHGKEGSPLSRQDTPPAHKVIARAAPYARVVDHNSLYALSVARGWAHERIDERMNGRQLTTRSTAIVSSRVVATRAIIEGTGGTLDVQMYVTEGDPPVGSRA